MFYDLNVAWSAQDANLPRTLAFLHELGYDVVALNYTINGKLPNELTCAIPDPLPITNISPKLTILRRVTLISTESYQNARLNALAKNYDLLALRPTDERSLQQACTSLDCDIISLDLSQRLPYYFKHKLVMEAIKCGKRFEICYSQAFLDTQSRRNLISNATQLIRATRGRGLLFPSGVREGPLGCRAPFDVINLATVWGLSQERAHESMTNEARSTVVMAKLKRTGWRGVVDVVYGGEKPVQEKGEKQAQKMGKGKQKQKNNQQQTGGGQNPGQKRKAEALAEGSEGTTIAQRTGNPAKQPKQ